MEDLTLYQADQLPDTLEDLTQFVLVGQATLNAYMLKLRTVNKLSVAQEIRDQTLKEAQDVSTALIAAEQRIGEILLSIPTAGGKRTDLETSATHSAEVKTKSDTISEMGYDRHEAQDYQTMAKNPEVVQRVIEDALSRGDVVTKTQVLKEIKAAKEEAKKQAEEETHKAIKDIIENGGASPSSEMFNENPGLKKLTEEIKERLKKIEEEQKALERAEAELEELRQREPEPEIIQVVPDDYGKLKEDCEKAKSAVERAEQDYIKVWHQSLEKDKKIRELESQLGRDKLLKDADRDVTYFITSTHNYIRMYGGHIWSFEQYENLSDYVKKDLIKAIQSLDGFAQQLLKNIGGGLNE